MKVLCLFFYQTRKLFKPGSLVVIDGHFWSLIVIQEMTAKRMTINDRIAK